MQLRGDQEEDQADAEPQRQRQQDVGDDPAEAEAAARPARPAPRQAPFRGPAVAAGGGPAQVVEGGVAATEDARTRLVERVLRRPLLGVLVVAIVGHGSQVWWQGASTTPERRQ